MVTHYSDQHHQKQQAGQQIFFQMIGLTSHFHSGLTRTLTPDLTTVLFRILYFFIGTALQEV
jgi:hypothetical protein